MTNREEIRRFAKAVYDLADRADRLGLELPNGGLVGCILATLAFDLEQSENREKREPQAGKPGEKPGKPGVCDESHPKW